MAEQPHKPHQGERFLRQVGDKEARKLKAQGQVLRTVWSGLGMMGLVGWSVAVPTLLGAFFGNWLDKHHPANHSWLLSLLLAGLMLGCLNAWHWVAREHKIIRSEAEEKRNNGKGKHDDH